MGGSMSETYVCDHCGEEKEKDWSDEEAAGEFLAKFGRPHDPAVDALICDSCYSMFEKWEKVRVMNRQQLLEWLSEADSSAYGECKCVLLDELLSDGAVIITPDIKGDPDYARVRLTETGWAEVAKGRQQ